MELPPPFLSLDTINADQIAEFITHNIDITSSSIDKSISIAAVAKEMGKIALVHLKIDTGMERIGVHWYNAQRFIEKSCELESIKIKGIFSHLAKAESDADCTPQQVSRFESVLNIMEKKKVLPELVHLANSAGIMNNKNLQSSMVQPGIMLYGYNPNGYLPDVTFGGRMLKPGDDTENKSFLF